MTNTILWKGRLLSRFFQPKESRTIVSEFNSFSPLSFISDPIEETDLTPVIDFSKELLADLSKRWDLISESMAGDILLVDLSALCYNVIKFTKAGRTTYISKNLYSSRIRKNPFQ